MGRGRGQKRSRPKHTTFARNDRVRVTKAVIDYPYDEPVVVARPGDVGTVVHVTEDGAPHVWFDDAEDAVAVWRGHLRKVDMRKNPVLTEAQLERVYPYAELANGIWAWAYDDDEFFEVYEPSFKRDVEAWIRKTYPEAFEPYADRVFWGGELLDAVLQEAKNDGLNDSPPEGLHLTPEYSALSMHIDGIIDPHDPGW